MSLADYLAKNYLTDKKKQKKSKRPPRLSDGQPSSSSSSLNTGTTTNTKPQRLPIAQAENLKTKGWSVVSTGEEAQPPVMASGARAGLQTGAQVAEQIRLKEEKELAMLRQTSAEGLGKDAETVYRDASGAKVDIRSRLDERKRRREEEQSERERKKKEINMGLVQMLERQDQRDRLAKAATAGLSRYADDEELNAKLRSRDLEDDPMLSFNPEKSNKFISRTGRKLYREQYPENRFSIAPGHRWDGVDRSNGFEKAHFKKQLEVQREQTLSYTMQED